MNTQRAKQLLEKYLNGTCTREERIIFESWYNKEIRSREDNPQKVDLTAMKTDIYNKLPLPIKASSRKVMSNWSRFSVAASILICIGVVFYFYQKNQITITEITAKHDIAPGGNKAFLTLADGKRIVLTDARIGKLAEQSGVKILKAGDGQLVYTVSDLTKKNNKVNEFNTIETPNGGQYQIKLPDGTKVWLNAASSLKFPSSFSRLVNRRVELLRGEAYFEVAKDKKHPFIVQTGQQEVEVLGTHFNINNYSDESFTKTTLFEGSVRVSPVDKDGTKEKPIVLKPNEQALLRANTIKVTDADTEEALAWKNGYFKFHDENIESVMRKVARWYNIKVQYSGSIPNQGLEGTMSREQNLSVVLNKLQTTGLVKFEVNGNTVIVSK